MHRVRRHDDQLLPLASFSFFSSSFLLLLLVAVAVPVVAAVAAVVWGGSVAASEDGVQGGTKQVISLVFAFKSSWPSTAPAVTS